MGTMKEVIMKSLATHPAGARVDRDDIVGVAEVDAAAGLRAVEDEAQVGKLHTPLLHLLISQQQLRIAQWKDLK